MVILHSYVQLQEGIYIHVDSKYIAIQWRSDKRSELGVPVFPKHSPYEHWGAKLGATN